MKIKKSLFEYPKEIFNEGEVLKIYKEKFPEIINEYRKVAEKSYCEPEEYQKIVNEKSKKFDILFEKLINKYEKTSHTLENLIKIDALLHKNYAFNFWLISYAVGEGPLAFHYVNLIESFLKKLYKSEGKILAARNLLIKTDFEIFYYKILLTSVELFEELNKNKKTKEFLDKARKLKIGNRKIIFDKLTSYVLSSEEHNSLIIHVFLRHKNNKTPLYNLLNQGIDNYKENKLLVKEHENVKKRIEGVLKDADKNLPREDGKKLRKIYLIVRAMLAAKDSTFGRKDIKMLNFWKSLTREIIKLFNEKYKTKINPNESFLIIPWILPGYSPASNCKGL